MRAERDILVEADHQWVVKMYYSFQVISDYNVICTGAFFGSNDEDDDNADDDDNDDDDDDGDDDDVSFEGRGASLLDYGVPTWRRSYDSSHEEGC